jgi:hypothetical protein
MSSADSAVHCVEMSNFRHLSAGILSQEIVALLPADFISDDRCYFTHDSFNKGRDRAMALSDCCLKYRSIFQTKCISVNTFQSISENTNVSRRAKISIAEGGIMKFQSIKVL